MYLERVMSLRIGVATVDFTPPVGLPMMGNLRCDYASTGVHDPLFAKAAVFADSAGTKIALVAMDVCMLNRDQVAFMRRHIAGQCAIPAENILIAATHIHSGPATMSLYTSPKADDEQIEAFLATATEAVVLANSNLHDATVRLGYSNENRLSFYRRIKCKDGTGHMNWETLEPGFVDGPFGQVDPLVSVLSVEHAGQPISAIVNFALHPAILDYENSLYSAEYPGYLAQAISKIISKDFRTIFFNGCCGNVNHIDYTDLSVPRRGYAATQRTGYMLAAAAKEAMNSSVPLEGEEIAILTERVMLKRLPISHQTYEWSKKALEELKINPPDGVVDGLPKEYSAPVWIEMYEKQHTDDQVEVMAIRIADLAIVGLPGEVFCEFGKEIRNKSPAKHTIVIELANDAIGYLPTPEAFDQGGYEITPGATRYQKDAGQRLTSSALRQLDSLFK